MKNQDELSYDCKNPQQILENNKKKCLFNNRSFALCINKTCTQDAIICQRKQCECRKEHFRCPQLLIQSLKNTIESKIVPIDKIHDLITGKIDNTIDKLSEFREKLSIRIKQDLKFYGLSLTDMKFLNVLNQSNEKSSPSLTGKEVSQFFSFMTYEWQKQTKQDQLEGKFISIWQEIDDFLNQKTSQILGFLELMKFKISSLSSQIVKESKIALTQQYRERLMEMFAPKIVSSTTLLYRASENDFLASEFHELCDNIPHTLVLCETAYGKIIGGYTPLPWNKEASKREVKDQSGESFLFSLTNNDKFVLQRDKIAIYQNESTGPAFGNGYPDFYINNQSHVNDSYTLINHSYKNEKYLKDNPESQYKFNGNPQKRQFYLTKEWEVWGINFQK